MHIGEIIHRLRKDKKMTLQELSEKSRVALATLSRIENGKMTGTLESHMSIADSLEISLPDFYKDLDLSKKTLEVKTKTAQKEVFVHDRSAVSEILVSKPLNKKMMPVVVAINKGGSTHKEQTKIGIEKFVYVLEGKIEASVGDEKYNLAKGDTLYFESSLPHQFKNISTSEARLISVSSPPAL